MPRASSRSSSSPFASCSCAAASVLAGGGRILLQRRADHAQVERQRDEPLLRAVVQVALEPPALGIADLDDPRARRGELLEGVGVGQPLGDEVGEVAQPLLEVLGQRLGRARRRGQRAPEAAGDADRRGDRSAVARALEVLGELPPASS